MKFKRDILIISCIVLLLVGTAEVRGQWLPDGNPVCTEEEDQDWPSIVYDDAGGCIIVWADEREGDANKDIYAQRFDAAGNPIWVVGGIVICDANAKQYSPSIDWDRLGGAVIVWTDTRNYTTSGTDIYAQRIDSDGNILWDPNGHVVCSASRNQLSPKVRYTSMFQLE